MPGTGDILDNRYQLGALLGEGAAGSVFRADDLRTGAAVAVKVLGDSSARNERAIARFRREVGVVARLQHPNTVRVFDCGDAGDGRLYLVMELLSGESLARRLERLGQLSDDDAVSVLRQVLRSLAEAHAAGIVHRDVKPANVLLVPLGDGELLVKVIDFGIAKCVFDEDVALTATDEIACSPRYVAPERIVDSTESPRSDLYSLGVMGIELFTGRPPFDVDNAMGLLMLHGAEDQPVPMPEELEATPVGAVLRRAVEKAPARRFASADEMLAALDHAVRLPVAGAADELAETHDLPAPARRRMPAAGLALLAGSAVVGGLIAAFASGPGPDAGVADTADVAVAVVDESVTGDGPAQASPAARPAVDAASAQVQGARAAAATAAGPALPSATGPGTAQSPARTRPANLADAPSSARPPASAPPELRQPGPPRGARPQEPEASLAGLEPEASREGPEPESSETDVADGPTAEAPDDGGSREGTRALPSLPLPDPEQAPSEVYRPSGFSPL